jgi:hypothetical protein
VVVFRLITCVRDEMGKETKAKGDGSTGSKKAGKSIQKKRRSSGYIPAEINFDFEEPNSVDDESIKFRKPRSRGSKKSRSGKKSKATKSSSEKEVADINTDDRSKNNKTEETKPSGKEDTDTKSPERPKNNKSEASNSEAKTPISKKSSKTSTSPASWKSAFSELPKKTSRPTLPAKKDSGMSSASWKSAFSELPEKTSKTAKADSGTSSAPWKSAFELPGKTSKAIISAETDSGMSAVPRESALSKLPENTSSQIVPAKTDSGISAVPRKSALSELPENTSSPIEPAKTDSVMSAVPLKSALSELPENTSGPIVPAKTDSGMSPVPWKAALSELPENASRPILPAKTDSVMSAIPRKSALSELPENISGPILPAKTDSGNIRVHTPLKTLPLKQQQPSKDAINKLIDSRFHTWDLAKNTIADVYKVVEDHFDIVLYKENRKVIRRRLVDLSTDQSLQQAGVIQEPAPPTESPLIMDDVVLNQDEERVVSSDQETIKEPAPRAESPLLIDDVVLNKDEEIIVASDQITNSVASNNHDETKHSAGDGNDDVRKEDEAKPKSEHFQEQPKLLPDATTAADRTKRKSKVVPLQASESESNKPSEKQKSKSKSKALRVPKKSLLDDTDDAQIADRAIAIPNNDHDVEHEEIKQKGSKQQMSLPNVVVATQGAPGDSVSQLGDPSISRLKGAIRRRRKRFPDPVEGADMRDVDLTGDDQLIPLRRPRNFGMENSLLQFSSLTLAVKRGKKPHYLLKDISGRVKAGSKCIKCGTIASCRLHN